MIFVGRDPAEIRDALLDLAGDESRRRQVAEQACAAGRREFGLEPFVSAYEDLYRDVLR